MKALFTVEVPDEFLEQRVREHAEEDPDGKPDTPVELFRGRCQDVAADDLHVAFFSWPIEVSVVVEP